MNKNSLWRKTECYIALGMLLFAGVLLWQILNISQPDSRMLPLFALIIVIASFAGQVHYILKHKDQLGDVRAILMKKKELAVFFMLLASYFLYDVLGFYTTIFLLLVGITMTVQMPLTGKKAAAAIIYDIVLMVLIYICFAVLLGMVTPAGLII